MRGGIRGVRRCMRRSVIGHDDLAKPWNTWGKGGG